MCLVVKMFLSHFLRFKNKKIVYLKPKSIDSALCFIVLLKNK
ncbi:hypothetical protein NU08_4584 [Flavobacterium anhuiense]|uniref:Uncharacterized protein n=1 Tax=Flavobacterium anhuiense TaxID=459526 RepID=A0A444VRY2_9FLAO|nr:hypothetical protein NU08_4584 [Flavobacterium anhuiense]